MYKSSLEEDACFVETCGVRYSKTNELAPLSHISSIRWDSELLKCRMRDYLALALSGMSCRRLIARLYLRRILTLNEKAGAAL